MKKLFLASLVAVALMLPAMNFTSQAAGLTKRVVNTGIIEWVFFATSDTEDGEIMQINIYRLSTGELVKSQASSGYSASVGIKDLPRGAYSAVVYCKNVTVSKQFKI
jgi:hypothetical protein